MEFKNIRNYEMKVPIVKVNQFGNPEINYESSNFATEEYYFVGNAPSS